MPVRWIEEREARQVLADAQCDALDSKLATKGLWAEWLRRWVGAAVPEDGVETVTLADGRVEPPAG